MRLKRTRSRVRVRVPLVVCGANLRAPASSCARQRARGPQRFSKSCPLPRMFQHSVSRPLKKCRVLRVGSSVKKRSLGIYGRIYFIGVFDRRRLFVSLPSPLRCNPRQRRFRLIPQMLELRRDLDFTKESLRTQNRRQLRPQDLDRDLAVVFEIFRYTRSAKRMK